MKPLTRGQHVLLVFIYLALVTVYVIASGVVIMLTEVDIDESWLFRSIVNIAVGYALGRSYRNYTAWHRHQAEVYAAVREEYPA